MRNYFGIVGIAVLSLLSCRKDIPSSHPLFRVPYIDVLRLPGDWNIVAKIPTIVNRSTTLETANFELFSDYSMKIHWKSEKNGENGFHWNFRVSPSAVGESSVWSVAPFWPLSFNLQVTEFSADYSWFVLASADRRYVWIFSREKVMAPLLLDGLVAQLKAMGFDVDAIVRL